MIYSNCCECGTPTSHSLNVPGGLRVCLTCFFDDSIPDPVARTRPDFPQLEKKRQAALRARAEGLLEKHKDKIIK